MRIIKSPPKALYRLQGWLAVLSLLLVQCRQPASETQLPAQLAMRQFGAAHYDSAIQNWNAAFAGFKAAGQWDSLYDYAEKYIIAHSRIYEVQEGNAFLDTLSIHLLAQYAVDSIALSKLWVRRSELLYTAGMPRLARDTLIAVLQLRERLLKPPHPLLADACDYLQIAYAQDGDMWTSAEYGENGIRMYKACLAAGADPDACSNLPWMIGNVGEVYNALGYYDRAIVFLREAYDSLSAQQAPVDSRMNYLIQLGGSYRRKGDFRTAISLFKEALDSLQGTDARIFEAEAYKQLALCYKETGLRDQMSLYAGRQYEINTNLHSGNNHSEQAASAALLADCRMDADDLAGAAKYIGEALAIYQNSNDTTSLDFISVLSLRARLLRQRRFADSARTLFATVIEKRIAVVGDTNDLVAIALLDAARNEDGAGQFGASKRAAQRALRIFSRTRNSDHPYIRECFYLLARAAWKGSGDKDQALGLIGQATGAGSDQLSSAAAVTTDRSLLHLLELRAAVLLPDTTSTNIAAWQKSLDSYKELAAAYSRFLNFSVFEGARFAEGGTAIQAIKDGFLPAYRLYTLTGNEVFLQDALDFSEQGRTGSIRLALQHYEANKFAQVPDSIIGREEQLRIACAYYEKLLLSAQSVAAPAAKTAEWKDSLLAQHARYSNFISYVQSAYPAYYKLKLDARTITVAGMKQLAESNHTTIVEYLFAGGQLYAFVCNEQACTLQRLPVGEAYLENEVEACRAAMARADAGAFAGAAARIYSLVVQPLQPLLQGTGVCVIPDGPLSYVSFESLLTAPADHPAGFRDLPYAILGRSWHYAYSATVLAQQVSLYSNRGSAARKQLAAIAPGFDRDVKAVAGRSAADDRFMQLLRQPWALELAGDLEKRRGARALTGTDATEESYGSIAGDASVLYIGTHAFPDDRDPMESELVFAKSGGGDATAADGYLHAYEIYRSPIQSRLVVLGGCETGIGRLRNGEGIVSLASGFAYAGCPSVVMSLWSIDDQQTAAILRSFFNNAASRQPVSTALTGAKRAYLSGAGDDDALYNPLYWSGLVSIGLDEPVPVPAQHDSVRNCRGRIALGAALVLVVAAAVRYRKRLLRPFRK